MENKILSALKAGGDMRPGEIADACGVAKDDVAKVIKKLVKEEKVFSPKRCFYAVKK